MTEVFNIVKEMYAEYNGSGMHMALFFACILYLIMQKKEKDKSFLFVGYTLLFFIICYFPVTAKIMIRLLGEGENVYWRIFWLLPMTIVMAYTGTNILMECSTKVKRYLLLAVMAVMIALCGTSVYNPTIFTEKQNNYKIPNDTIAVCDVIEADAAANGIEWKKLLVTNDLLTTIRQYNATILMPYGYSHVKGSKTETDGAAQLYRIINSADKDWELFSYYMEMEKCNYFAYPKDDAVLTALAEYGFENIGSSDNYYVYRRRIEDVRHEGQWLLTQYGGAEGEPIAFYTLQDTSGHLVVVDGGQRSDARYVRSVIRPMGAHVDAWIVTTPKKEHAGAFSKIYKKLKDITIDKVYAVDMGIEQWNELKISQLEYVYPQDEISVAGLTIEILHSYTDKVDEMSNDLLSDGSMVFKVNTVEDSMLFCSDIGSDVGVALLEEYGDKLQAEYVQMANHGNTDFENDFYQKINAKAAFFEAPAAWLEQEIVQKNIKQMEENGTKVYSFVTTPNQIILK